MASNDSIPPLNLGSYDTAPGPVRAAAVDEAVRLYSAMMGQQLPQAAQEEEE